MLTRRTAALIIALWSLWLGGAQTAIAQEKTTPAKETILFDFEGGSFDGWTLTGNCWEKQPATPKTFVDRSGHSVVSGIIGSGYLTTLHPHARQRGNRQSRLP